MENINRGELIAQLSEELEINKKRAGEVLDGFINVIEKNLSEGNKVSITNFLSIECKERAERNGVNPKTQEPMVIPAKVVPRVKFGKRLKDIVSGEIEL